jgi:4-amino-4-deoxychorismate lyase
MTAVPPREPAAALDQAACPGGARVGRESAARAEIADAVLLNGAAVEARRGKAPGFDLGSLLLDRGLHYGDGLFETVACRNARASFLEHHLERLALGCRRLAIGFGAFDALRAEVRDLAGSARRSILKILVTRGPATSRGYAPHGDESPSRVVLRYPWPEEDPIRAREGVAVRLSDLALGENPRLAGLKHLNRLELVLARADLAGSPFAEALLLSSSGRLVSGTFSNVFLASGRRLSTPRLDRCGVAGVMRRVVMRLAEDEGFVVEEADLTAADLERAEELFLTNARIGIWPVRKLGSRALSVGRTTGRLQRRLERRLEEADA